MNIYMIRSKEFNTIQGLWTNKDKLIEWVLTQKYPWTAEIDETDLDAFMDQNQLSVFKDGIPGRTSIPWSDLFPME